MIIRMNGLTIPNISKGIIPIPHGAREWAKEQAKEYILGALDAVRDVLVDLSYDIALIGGGLCILFWVVGWKDGKRWAGILFLANVIIKLLLGSF